MEVGLNFFLNTLEEMLEKEYQQHGLQAVSIIENEKFINSLIAICVITQFFLNEKTPDLIMILNLCGVTTFEFWKILHSFALIDKTMPKKLFQNIFEIEGSLLFYHIWEPNSVVYDLLRKYFILEKQNKVNPSHDFCNI